MRLALIGPSAPLRGGIAEYHDRLAASLAARGHAVLRLSFSRMYPRMFFPGRTPYVPEPVVDAPGLVPAEPLLDSIAPPSWLRLARRARTAEVAICEWWHPFFAPALGTIAALLRRRGVPVVLVCHNFDPHEPMPGGTLLTRLMLRQAAAFVAHSRRDVARLAAAFPTRPVALVMPPAEAPLPCPHGEDPNACAASLGIAPAPRRALFFGYVREYKGLPTLIEALRSGPPDLQLVVAGEIYHRGADHYRALASRLGVSDRLVLIDRYVAAREVACCFRAADVVALPYWDASQSAVIPLAMACGRAVVATTVGGLPDLVRSGETGLLVPPRDPVALAAALGRALEHATAWGAAAARAASAWTWDRAAAEIETLVASVVSARATPW